LTPDHLEPSGAVQHYHVGIPVGLEDEMAQLAQADIATIDTPGMYRFARGLFLQVTGPDSKSWIYRFTVNGTPRWKGLGSARDVTLASARREVDGLRVNLVSKKIDPIAEKKQQAARKREADNKAVPFRQRAAQYIAAHAEGWRNAKHRAQWDASLQTYVYPTIGDLPSTTITASHVVEILRPIWTEKPETARRVRGRIETILDYAADPDDTLYRNPATMTAQLLKKLPKAARGKGRARHHPSLPYADIGPFMVDLRARDGIAAKALGFAVLTAARTGEVLGATWDEIDMDGRLWVIPGHRMKAGEEHRVPLSSAALAILTEMRATAAGKVVFPAAPADAPLSDMAMLALLRRMGRADITTHGFRSTFRTWAEERTNFGRARTCHRRQDEGCLSAR
jgi:integrase